MTRSRVSSGAKTRDRVLGVALTLFNERGIDRVTTAEIARAAGINEGNLYYYFQKKEQLAVALFDEFAALLLETAERDLGDPSQLASYVAYQRGFFDVMWDFRFFYRDTAVLKQMAPSLREPLADMTARGQAAVRGVFAQMRAHRLLRATDEEIDTLITNIWIVSTYWMDFRHAAGAEVTPDDLLWGLRQVEALYRPYMTVPNR